MKASLSRIFFMFRREMSGYFRSPLAYVFIVIFLLLCSIFTFNVFFGKFFLKNEAGLAESFFVFHPWLFLLLVPALAMRLWAEENKSGTVELLLTLPVATAETVLAKFLAAWAVLAVSLLLTFPIVVTVNKLGSPDNGVIAAGYLASILLAGAYMSIGSFTSAISKNQVVSFILAVVICFVLLLAGHPAVTDYFSAWAPEWAISIMAGTGVFSHYGSLMRGVIDLRDIFYFASLVIFMLCATGVALNSRRSA